MEIKQFALILTFYSTKANQLLRQYLYLPRPSSIKQWRASVDASPWFLSECFKIFQ